MKNKGIVSIVIIISIGTIVMFNHFSKQSEPLVNDKKEKTFTTPKNFSEQIETKVTMQDDKANVIKNAEPEIILSESEVIDLLSQCGVDTEKLNAPFGNSKSVIDGLEKSTLAEDKLGFALFSSPKEGSRLDNLYQFSLNNPEEPVSRISLIGECTTNSNNSICNENLIDSTSETVKKDGAFWLAATAYFISQKNDAQIYEAITNLDESTFFSNNYAKRIKLFTQIMENNQFGHFGSNLITAIGVEAATIPDLLLLIATWCNNENNDVKTSNACLTVGRNIVERPTTFSNQAFGYSILKNTYQNENNEKAAEEIQRQINKFRSDQFISLPPYANLIMLVDEEFARNWLNNQEVLGESEAQKKLIVDLKQLVNTEKYYPCRVLFSPKLNIKV